MNTSLSPHISKGSVGMALAGAHDKKTTDYTTVTQIREDRNEYSKQKIGREDHSY